MACLSIVTNQGQDVNADHEEAYRAIGTPSIAQLKKMGIDEYDLPTAKAILKSMG